MRTVFLACPALPWYSGGTKHKREGGASMYRTEVKVAALPVAEWMKRYCFPGRFLDSCKQCPDYGRVWSCPPGVPEAGDYLGAYRMAHIIGVKVIYDDGERARALRSPKEAETVRQETYGVVKKALLEALLAFERVSPGAVTVAAGRCEQCEVCTRLQDLPCRRPERMRYSFSAFGFDLTALAKEQLGMDLLWAGEGLPEYNVAIAAFLTR